jgi:hypothetical protein
VAERYLEIYNLFSVDREPDDELVVDVFEEMLRAEVIFAGPSLYATIGP